MRTFSKVVLATLTFVVCFYSTTVAMSIIFSIDSAPLTSDICPATHAPRAVLSRKVCGSEKTRPFWPPIVTIGKVSVFGRVEMPPPACLDDAVTDARSVSPNTIVLNLLNCEREECRRRGVTGNPS
jgi:hypothetical protein